MAEARIGLVGLGVMGANLALNIADNGFPVVVHNRTTSVIDDFIANAGDHLESTKYSFRPPLCGRLFPSLCISGSPHNVALPPLGGASQNHNSH